MGFGGAASMNVSLKNNRNLLSKRDRFKNRLSGNTKGKSVTYNLPQAKPHVLKEIRERIKREQKDRQKKVVMIVSLLLSIAIAGLIYLNDNLLSWI
ncbi:hypothetical protein [Pontimicrobium sp. IMCC45349]|uniref:hypothetical protein n=1 Tax=Pontimicrobium sp. IMCC45349 TaxID=3391574 RepID=UPI0039A25081